MLNLDSKTVKLRLVEKDDVGFVLPLRADDNYNKFLSAKFPDVNEQKEWFRKYKKDETEGKEFCFVIEKVDGTPCGTVRVFDLKPDSFSWGSWILNQDKTIYAAIESAFLVYRFGFKNLGYSKSHFAVMKGNDKVVSFHEKMGAKKVGEDALDIFYTIGKESVHSYERRLSKIL